MQTTCRSRPGCEFNLKATSGRVLICLVFSCPGRSTYHIGRATHFLVSEWQEMSKGRQNLQSGWLTHLVDQQICCYRCRSICCFCTVRRHNLLSDPSGADLTLAFLLLFLWTPGDCTCISYKLGHKGVPLASIGVSILTMDMCPGQYGYGQHKEFLWKYRYIFLIANGISLKIYIDMLEYHKRFN